MGASRGARDRAGRTCEGAGSQVDPRLGNSEGASVSTQESRFVYGNSLEFLAGFPGSRHGMWCGLIAGKNDEMQRDDWCETTRDPAELPTAESVGRRAGERAVKRLGARKIATRQAPVLFEAPAAESLLGHFVSAVSSGGSVPSPLSFSTAWGNRYLRRSCA